VETQIRLNGSQVLEQLTPVAMALLGVLALMIFSALFVGTLKVMQLRRLLREERRFSAGLRQITTARDLPTAPEEPVPGARLLRALVDRVQRGAVGSEELRGLAQQVIAEEERRAAHLASVLQGIAATGPLLGLLGTVWGIIESFLAMDQSGSSSIEVVAPAMAGALLTTAFGLVAAIPSLLALQYAERRVGELVTELDAAAQTWVGLLLRE
jgi:biopolymer transport protein ExbB/TolQ